MCVLNKKFDRPTKFIFKRTYGVFCLSLLQLKANSSIVPQTSHIFHVTKAIVIVTKRRVEQTVYLFDVTQYSFNEIKYIAYFVINYID